ncbi:hypothetical protein C8Q75DRAFT_807677 [Abortiporus biennis]|nr:hypothetical protein C8Q75DRAFT_807677 [Abortiporus biennis]
MNSDLGPLRRLVTTHDATGKAILKSDDFLNGQVTDQGLEAAPIWVTESVPSKDNNLDVDGAERPTPGEFGIISPNGTNCMFTDLAPGQTTYWHRTSSVDHNILIHGKLALMLEDGIETLLENPGDVVIQRGTMHAWRNPGERWTRWVTVLVDAEPAKAALKAGSEDDEKKEE